jgi:hypothetical protein
MPPVTVSVEHETTIEVTPSPCGCHNEMEAAVSAQVAPSPCGCHNDIGLTTPAALFS